MNLSPAKTTDTIAMQFFRGCLAQLALPRTPVLAALFLAGCSQEPFYEPGDETPIETARNVRQRLETILADEAASASDEIDATEAVIDGILPGLSRKLSRSVENLRLPSQENSQLFAERVEVADIGLPDHYEDVLDYELRIGHWPVQEAREVAREDLAIWASLIDTVEFFENTSFKVVRGDFTDEEQTILHTLMKFNGLARRSDGYRYAVGKVYVDWVRVDEGEEENWRIKGWVTKHLETHDVEQLFFSDVLPEALDAELYAIATERSIDMDKRIAAVTVNLENDRTQEDVRLHLDDGMMPFSRDEFDAVLPKLSRKEQEYAYRFFGSRLKSRAILMRLLDLTSPELSELDLRVRTLLVEERRKQRPHVAERLQKTLTLVRETLDRQAEAANGKSKSSTALTIVDIDNDGLDDIFLARNDKCLLLRNVGDGTFEDIAAEINLPQSDGPFNHINHALFVDLDNDSDLDLLFGYWDGLEYYRNEDGRFANRTKELYDAYQPMGNVSLAAADYDGDGLVDIYVGTRDMFRPSQELMARSNVGFDEGKLFGEYLPDVQARRFYDIAMSDRADGTFDRPGPPNLLLKNMGGGRLALAPNSENLEVYRGTHYAAWSDYDGDGDQDLYVANDFGPNNFFRNEGNGVLVDITDQNGTADVGFGMGLSWGDYDNDGDQDLYVTNMYSKAGLRITTQAGLTDSKAHVAAHGNTLFRNNGDKFEKVSGVEPPDLTVEPGGWGWGAQFLDMDNDGFLDIYAPSGYISKPPGFDNFADT